jgi:predicted O-methyltransferase YrrM
MSLTGAAADVLAEYEERRAAEAETRRTMDPDEFALRRDDFLLSVGLEAAEFLHALILARGAQRLLELGTSYGYSTLFLADAARRTGGRLITMELDPRKHAYARERIARAGLSDFVEWRCGDALALLAREYQPFDFVLLDIWKELYVPCLEAFYPKLVPEAVVVADNMVEPAMERDHARAYRAAVAAKPDMTSVLLPIGQGIEVSCRWPADSSKL